MLHENDLDSELVELARMEVNLHEKLEGVMSSQAYTMGGIEDKLRQWLQKVRDIATQHNVQLYTITLALSCPPGIQASFTWQTKDKGNKVVC